MCIENEERMEIPMAAEVDNEIMLISHVYVCERVSSFIEICAIFAFAIDLVGKRERF